MTFIQKLVQLLAEESFDLTNTLIVLPSERPKKYIQKALFEHYQKPIFSPQMVTMDKWVRDLSKETVIDKTRALLNLYDVFLKDTKYQYQDSFQQFLNYGTALLNDYDELDRYLLDHKQVFKNLVDIKEIENWSFDAETLTPAQQKFMEFWEKLPGYYEVLNENLKAKGQCYMGKAYRHLAENIDLVFEKNKSLKVVFAGFNALSKAELAIMKQLKNMGRGYILFDVDKYYMEKKYHEAGFFIQQNLNVLDLPQKGFPNRLMGEPKQIDFIQCAYQTDQVKVASGLLKELPLEEQKDTLVLLADEKLIIPLLQNLPKELQKANITLGLPLIQSVVKSWVELFFNFQHHKSYFNTEALYIRDLQDFFNHPFLYNLLSEEEKTMVFNLDQNLISKNAIFKNLNALPLNERLKNLLIWMSESWGNNWNKALTNMKTCITYLYSNLDLTFEYERAVLQHFHSAVVELENLMAEDIPSLDFLSFKHIFQLSYANKRMAYHGNPVDGIQIMGLLETRALDFKKIICLGLNEDILPPTNPMQTMIPMDLRRYLGLPTPREKQGLFAHHLYRLLHHCEHFYAVYASNSSDNSNFEKSRYLQQWELEWLKDANEIVEGERRGKLHLQKYTYEINEKNQGQFIKGLIPKDENTMAKIKHYFEGPVSFSAINTYLTCPLDFYYKYILNFGEVTEVSEELESSKFGTIIHETLEKLYLPYTSKDRDGNPIRTQKVLTQSIIESFAKSCYEVLYEEFKKAFDNDESAFQSGYNHLLLYQAKTYLEKYFQYELQRVKEGQEIIIEQLEGKYTATMECADLKIQLLGKIDRIESVNGIINLIDYKTGNIKEELKLAKIEDYEKFKTNISKNTYLLQLMVYLYLYRSKNESKVDASLLFLKNINTHSHYKIELSDYLNLESHFKTFLTEIFEEILNPEIPFMHQQKAIYCQYC